MITTNGVEYLRFDGLKSAGIFTNRTALTRAVPKKNFPQGIKLSPARGSARIWPRTEIEAWLTAHGR